VILNSDELSGDVVHLEDGEPLPNILLQGREIKGGAYEALIIPPAPIKVQYGPIFWDINKSIRAALSSCDTVVVIGWSMPTTDRDAVGDLTATIRSRHSQVADLIVCQKGAARETYSRFEQVFWPKHRTIIWDKGFDEKFVKECLGPTIRNPIRNEFADWA
jgi:hypothetical protein